MYTKRFQKVDGQILVVAIRFYRTAGRESNVPARRRDVASCKWQQSA
jgi:hypothetical protein